ncbi:hypothetical protein COCON_G00010560 [Conger conger]|uniref:CARD domain-containing protein n=1 Tax=Conger conger TaxID=82655 RepID=A0A9Q1E2E3_CONCO|nr:uncharacterized protein si:dkey-29h14.10 [Conger conger]XP_061092835.1 uncharacterized protein si:dkey-29h14.10 [Conger conger]KAJ8288397.1 hypothetical protein COCON_G00010560 [Conger conger]
MSSCLVERISDYVSCKRTITPFESQLIPFQCTMDLQQASQFIQTVFSRGRRACQLFYKLLESCDPLLAGSFTGSPDRQDMAPTYIINIHDSTLNNCTFGSNNGHCINANRQHPPSYSPEHVRHEVERCSCGQQGAAQSSSSAPPSLQLHISDVEYVVIGDNNTVTAETVEAEGQEEEEEEEEQALI